MHNPYDDIMKEFDLIKTMLTYKDEQNRNNYPVYYLCDKAAEFLNITPNALRVIVCKNQIKFCKKLNKLYFLLDDLVEFIESGRVDTEIGCPEDILIKNQKSRG